MSTTTSSSDAPAESYQCAHDDCDTAFSAEAAVAGSFCSTACYYRHKGAKSLNKIRHDHRFCATCFSQLKDIQTPSDQWVQDHASQVAAALDRGAKYVGGDGGQLVLDCTGCTETARPVAADAVIGLQSPAPGAVLVTDDEPVDDQRRWRRRRRGRWACECGNVDHRHRDEVLERVEDKDVVLNLLYLLYKLYHEGVTDHRPDKQALFDALREHGRDWELAIGRALYEEPR